MPRRAVTQIDLTTRTWDEKRLPVIGRSVQDKRRELSLMAESPPVTEVQTAPRVLPWAPISTTIGWQIGDADPMDFSVPEKHYKSETSRATKEERTRVKKERAFTALNAAVMGKNNQNSPWLMFFRVTMGLAALVGILYAITYISSNGIGIG